MPLTRPRRAIVFAADHGIVSQGVSQWPSSVTRSVVEIMVQKRTASGVLADAFDCEYLVVDVGCLEPAHTANENQGIIVQRRIASGTCDMSREPAMSLSQFELAWEAGVEQVRAAANDGIQLLIGGEMGIGNSTSASCLTAAICGRTTIECVGRGAGLAYDRIEHKIQVVQRILDRNRDFIDLGDWKNVGAAFGGFEIVALAGMFTEANRLQMTILLDGFIATAGALLAFAIDPSIVHCMIAAHGSPEPGHRLALEHLSLEPVLEWGMCLGEASGALVALPLLDGAASIINRMATLREVAGT